MKFLTLLLLCCVAKDINSATTIGQLLSKVQLQLEAAKADAQKKVEKASPTTAVKVPNVPTVPKPSNPDQVIVNPPKIPLPNPKCDLKGLTALLKALFGRVKGSCSNVKKSRGPLKQQCEAAKANFTAEFNLMFTVTQQISYEFPSCSKVVDPAIKGFSTSAGKVFDALGAVSTASKGKDSKKCAKDVDVSVKNMAKELQTLLESVNSVTGSAKPAAGTNMADAQATSEVFLNNILLCVQTFLDLVLSVSSESSVEIGDITKTLRDAVAALSKKVESGSAKILGSVCISFSASVTIINKSTSSIDLEALTEECGQIETDLGEVVESASEIEEIDDEDEEEETTTPDSETATPEGETSTAGDETTVAGGETSTAGEEATTTGGEATSTSGETTTPGATPDEKPTATVVLNKISLTVTTFFASITKSCGALKTDVPAMAGGKVDASLTSVSGSLTALLALIQNSEASSTSQLSTEIDTAITAFVASLTQCSTTLTTVKGSLSGDTSVAGTTAASALILIEKTIFSISCQVITSLSVFFKKLGLFTTVKLDATCEAIAKIDVKTIVDFKKVTTDLTKITSPTELNAESCKKVVEELGKSTTKALGKIKGKFSAKFELRVSFIYNAFGHTLQNVKAPKVSIGVTKLQGSFSVLIKEIEKAYTCAKDKKAKSGASGSSEESSSSGEGSDEKTKCKPIASNSFKSVFEALLAVLDASKAQAADTTLDSKILEIFNLTLKQFLACTLQIFTGLSTSLNEQTLNASVLLPLGTEILTKATSEEKIDLKTLTPTVDDLICYGNAVDSATPAVDAVKEIETKISEPPTAGGETKDTKVILSELSTSAVSALTGCSKSVSSFTKYFTKSVDGVGKGITDIGSLIVKFINGVTKTTEVEQQKVALEEFLSKISLAIVGLSTTYTECSASTKTQLDPKGYNAKSALKFIFKSITTIISSIFTCFKVYIVDIPADFVEFYTDVSDACKADASTPDSEPSELGDKVKASCDKHSIAKGK